MVSVSRSNNKYDRLSGERLLSFSESAMQRDTINSIRALMHEYVDAWVNY